MILFLVTRPEVPGETAPSSREVCGQRVGGPLSAGRFRPLRRVALWVLRGSPGVEVGYHLVGGSGNVALLFRIPEDAEPDACLSPPCRVALRPGGPFALAYRAPPGPWRSSEQGWLRAFAGERGTVLLSAAVALLLVGAEPVS